MSANDASSRMPPTANNLTLAPSNPLNFREDIVRLDYRINDKHSLYFRWLQDANSLLDPFGTFSSSNLNTTPTNRNRPGESLLLSRPGCPVPRDQRGHRNSSWVSQHILPAGNTWQRSTYGFQYPQFYPGGWHLSQWDPAGRPSPPTPDSRDRTLRLISPTTDIQVGDTVSWVKGNHVMKAGFRADPRSCRPERPPLLHGQCQFQASGNPNTTGNALADALLGNFRSYTEASADPIGFFRFTQPMAFVQDSWKVSRKLSFEFGVRWRVSSSQCTPRATIWRISCPRCMTLRRRSQ